MELFGSTKFIPISYVARSDHHGLIHLEDKSRWDAFVKLGAIVQISWVAVDIIAQAHERLARDFRL